ncbi:AcrR family transcriptional regulator [Streptosporangium lutulentum]|uniref:AcrR family transcriptional regulator n=1 Tax=Streptosporangium lutulentum TaxID=1461250 RepID=A0ABT9Q730_9ACTN|nr:TetR/AcrR family transcriptional regulator [Streptosporangium lutulentum]MDP9842181.1 AcrR family transcriptional regulator [Streptosporangium lutulentum]
MRLEEIQQAAVRLFAQKGYAATGIRELGRAVGINSATLYHYAGSKEEVLTGIMRSCLEQLLRSALDATSTSADPGMQLARLVRTHVGLCALNPLTAKVTDQEIRALRSHDHEALIGLRDDYESIFAEVIERGARTGVFHLTDLRITRLALLEMCNGVANWYRPDGRLDITEVQDQFVELVCRLVGMPPVSREESGELPAPIQLASEPITDYPHGTEAAE